MVGPISLHADLHIFLLHMSQYRSKSSDIMRDMIKEKIIDDKVLVISAIFATLIFTPINFDALIIPKVIVIFCTALYLSPKLFKFSINNYFSKKIRKIFLVSLFGALIHLFIIFMVGNAPFDQQLWGRTGRGFGLIVYFSFLIFLFTAIRVFSRQNISLVLKGIAISGLISGGYAILQRNSLDIFAWDSKTNGIIGTLGNPNFQSSFGSAGYIAMLTLVLRSRFKIIFTLLTVLFSLYLIYICQSTQGYIGLLAATFVFIAVKLWYQGKFLFYGLLLTGTIFTVFGILGMVNRGPLSYYLYKVSVQSRGDFFRSAFTTANEHPFFGVGLDSFGDHYLANRDSIAASHIFAELTDNAHNYFLEFAATGGYPFAVLYFLLILLSFLCLVTLVKKSQQFDHNISALFSIWTVFQLQSLISPGNISIMLWNFMVCGAAIGAYVKENCVVNSVNKYSSTEKVSLGGVFLIIVGLILSYPYFNGDRLFRIGLDQRDGNSLIKQVNSYPRFVNKYRMVGLAFLESNLPEPALMIGKDAVKFNPDAVSGWALIFYNPIASASEKDEAKLQIQRLDPWNKEVPAFKY